METLYNIFSVSSLYFPSWLYFPFYMTKMEKLCKSHCSPKAEACTVSPDMTKMVILGRK